MADVIETTCPRCSTLLELDAVPTDAFICGRCGAELVGGLVQVVHRIAATMQRSDFRDDDPTPVETPVPLLPVKGTG